MILLRQYIENKRAQNEKLLSVYLTAGYPNMVATLPLLRAIVAGGADMIELGIPFSDPLADGTTIQAASQRALDSGATLALTLDTAKQFGQKSGIPLLLMGYANPFMQYGWDRLVKQAKDAGVSGYIIPDLPPEESELIAQKMQSVEQSPVFLVSPNTSSERIALVNKLTTSFIYAVSVTGTTGVRNELPAETAQFLQALRQKTRHPVLVGFGISNPVTAKKLSAFCDGVIVGSALINRIAQNQDIDAACEDITQFVRELKSAI
jgi:tryptophan synthase alpha chain